MKRIHPPLEIPLEVWAGKQGIPFRTTKRWAHEKRIPAQMKTTMTQVTVKRRVRKYMIPADTPIPDFVN